MKAGSNRAWEAAAAFREIARALVADFPNGIELPDGRPWEIEGISKSCWYKRQLKAERKAAQQVKGPKKGMLTYGHEPKTQSRAT